MKIAFERNDEYTIARIFGRLDLNSAEDALAELDGELETLHPRHLIIDFGAVEYLSSYGIRVLVVLSKKQAAQHRLLSLVNVPEVIMGVLRTSALDRFFRIFATGEAAAASADAMPEVDELL